VEGQHLKNAYIRTGTVHVELNETLKLTVPYEDSMVFHILTGRGGK
jgi:hypothetical protein